MMKRATVAVVVCGAAMWVGICQVNTADARPRYFSAFKARYLGEDEAQMTDEQKALQKIVDKEKCAVCHDERKDASGKANKANRNPFGMALSKYLTEDDRRDEEKAIKMLEKIEKEKPQDAKPTDPTFLELIRQGKLPFAYPQE
jgi:mono/diheme cytochrome c family protein